MQKIIRIDRKVVVIFEDGSYLEREDVDDDLFADICNADSEEEIVKLMNPMFQEALEKYLTALEVQELVKSSKLLTVRGESVYWDEISQLSMPTELITAVVEAEHNGDEVKLETYKNFWTLMCLNPDERCRKNLFWFLNKNGLVLARCGFFVAYRNANLKEVLEDGTKVWTDAHSGTTTIKIGEVTSIDRAECDDNQDVTCSRGLHLGARSWLKRNYFGTQGLACLCNPLDVTAVPYLDSYGKLRTCAYLPIAEVQFDEDGDVIPVDLETGFDCSYVTKALYEGLMGTEEDSPYRIEIPNALGINKNTVTDNILQIAMDCIAKREV